MTDIKEPSSSRDPGSVSAIRKPGEIAFLSQAQPLLLILFVGSTAAFLVMWLAWRGGGIVPIVGPSHGVSPTSSQTFWLIVASATSLASLLGMVSNTVLGLRKEQREARAETLDRRRQELEIEKIQLELEREKASAAAVQSTKEPPFPEDGERNRLRVKWSELDGKYQELTRLLGAVDKDLGQALDSERRLVLREHRDELAVQRDAISITMADLERRLAELESAG